MPISYRSVKALKYLDEAVLSILLKAKAHVVQIGLKLFLEDLSISLKHLSLTLL